VIDTPRLRLRRFRADDLPAFAAYRADPAVARYQGWDVGYSFADAQRFLAAQDGLALGATGAWVQTAIARREDDALLGDCASFVFGDQPGSAEIGITLARASQRRGIAAEALGALIGELFAVHRLHRVIAQADDRNAAVHRLLEGLGLRLEARHVEADWFKGEWTTLRVYAVLAREWVSP
jgi:RimJ/RimL family protein N-acetyltransferase